MSLQDLKKQISKDHGDVVKTGEEVEYVPLLCSFGSLSLDVVVGIGGMPRGRILEYFGPPSGGKTTFSILTGVEVQKAGGVIAFVDLENSFDRKWFQNLGGSVEEDKFIYLKPEAGADAFEIVDKVVSSDSVDLVIVDSVSALATEEELTGGYGDSHMAQLARLMSDGLKKLNVTMIKHKRCSVIFINQIRSTMDKYKPETTSGGNALLFYSSVRLRIERVSGQKGIVGDVDNPEGFKTKIKVSKNKVGPPLRSVETTLYLGVKGKWGVDINEEILDVAIGMNVVERGKKDDEGTFTLDEEGSHYRIDGQVFYGLPKLKTYIAEDPTRLGNIKALVLQYINSKEKPEPDSFKAETEKPLRKQRKSKE